MLRPLSHQYIVSAFKSADNEDWYEASLTFWALTKDECTTDPDAFWDYLCLFKIECGKQQAWYLVTHHFSKLPDTTRDKLRPRIKRLRLTETPTIRERLKAFCLNQPLDPWLAKSTH